jgi:Uma2 family endonuclease
LLTAEEFYHLPEPSHGGKMELIRGEVVTHMPVGGPHGEFAGILIMELGPFCRRHKLGVVGPEVGFILATGPDTVRAPDVHFVRRDRLVDGHMPSAFFVGAPDLAIEVTSPDDTDREVAEKLGHYQAAATPRVWVVRPELKTVTVHRLDGTAKTFRPGDVLTSDDAGFDVEGFELSVAELFDE